MEESSFKTSKKTQILMFFLFLFLLRFEDTTVLFLAYTNLISNALNKVKIDNTLLYTGNKRQIGDMRLIFQHDCFSNHS